jgi:hypothetical protein
MLRSIQIQPDNVSGFGFELRIIAGHVALQAVRLQTSLFPYAMDSVLADAQCRGELPATPVGRAILRPFPGSRKNPGSQCRSQHRSRLPGMIRIQTVDSGGQEPLLPATDGRAVVRSRCLMALKDAPSASIRMSLARKTYPAGRERD